MQTKVCIEYGEPNSRMKYKGVVGIEVVRSCDHDLHFTTFISPDDGNDVFTDSTPDWLDYVFSDRLRSVWLFDLARGVLAGIAEEVIFLLA